MFRHGLVGALAAAPRQLRLIAPLSLLPALALVLCIPLIASLRNLQQPEAGLVLDMLFCISGALLMTPLAQPEQNRAVREVVAGKGLSYLSVLAARVLIAALAILVLAGTLCAAMWLSGSQFPFWQFVLGTSASALFLGALGFTGSVVSDNWMVGYLLPVLFYFLCYGSGERYLGYFYLFSLPSNGLVHKVVQGISGVILLTASFVLLYIKSCKRGLL